MSKRGEMWVHGNSVIVQYPGGEGLSPFTPNHRMMYARDPEPTGYTVAWSGLLGIRSGNGATFEAAYGTPGIPTSNSCHCNIPTPAIFPRLDVADHLEIPVHHDRMYHKTDPTNDPNLTIQDIAA